MPRLACVTGACSQVVSGMAGRPCQAESGDISTLVTLVDQQRSNEVIERGVRAAKHPP
jgi:hypothetical protein